MTILRATSLVLAVSLLAGVSACNPSTEPIAPPGTGGTLYTGSWYMHEANGDPLPAIISERVVGVAVEKTVLDSSILVLNTDDTYEQRYWTRVLVTETLDRSDFVIDQGTYAAEGLGYRFTSNFRAREFTMLIPTIGFVETTEQMLYLAGAPRLTLGTYRLSRP